MKDWNQSKTVIANGLALIISLATLLSGDTLGLPPEVARYASITLAIASVVNLWLRSLTSEPIRLPGQSAPVVVEEPTNGSSNG